MSNGAQYGKARRVRERDVDRVMRAIVRRVEAKRLELDVPAREIQAATRIHPATLSHLNAHTKRLTLRLLVRLALALGISFEELVS